MRGETVMPRVEPCVLERRGSEDRTDKSWCLNVKQEFTKYEWELTNTELVRSEPSKYMCRKTVSCDGWEGNLEMGFE